MSIFITNNFRYIWGHFSICFIHGVDSLNDEFIRKRLDTLRLAKGVSERKMSLDIGRNSSYMYNISSGKALPSMGEFLYICEYLGVTPHEFFDGESSQTAIQLDIISMVRKLDDTSLAALAPLFHHLLKD